MKKFNSILIRYFVLLVIGVFLIEIFRDIIRPLTILPSFFLLDIFYDVALSNASFLIQGKQIFIIDACLAVSAYFLLLILNLTTPNMTLKKRYSSVIVSIFVFLFLNVARIVFLSILYLESAQSFEVFHKIFWYALSVLFVIVVWFATCKIFKIKEIPFYTDVKYLLKEAKYS